jgi:hydroxyethylthiazole kinase
VSQSGFEEVAIDRAGKIWEDFQRIRAESPLVHNITNYVVMNTTANALLALGASPVMAHAEEEVAEMAAIARALVINIGTLSQAWVRSMLLAGQAAKRKGIPVVLDPVGAGATRFRTDTALRLIRELSPAVVRGNASEIRALAYDERTTKGVDSAHGSEEALDAGRALAASYRTVAVVSGAIDLVVFENSLIRVANGHPSMPRVTGLGCTATALIGAFAAVNPSPGDAAAHAMAVMGIAGEIAAERAAGPGSFLPAFLDALANLREDEIRRRLKLEEA